MDFSYIVLLCISLILNSTAFDFIKWLLTKIAKEITRLQQKNVYSDLFLLHSRSYDYFSLYLGVHSGLNRLTVVLFYMF